MKEPTLGPIFACFYQGMCDVSRAHGYALSVHGTLVTDMDLVAVPWTDDAVSAEDLVAAIKRYLGAVSFTDVLASAGLSEKQIADHLDALGGRCPTPKPHGRKAWNLYLSTACGAKVDLSVMPRCR